MILKFIKIFFSILALMLLAFLLNVTFYFSNYSKNIEVIADIALNKDESIYQYNFSDTGSILRKKYDEIKGKSEKGFFEQNINLIDKIYFSNIDSFSTTYESGEYTIDLKKGLYVLDLNDLSVKFKIKGLGFEIIPKSAGMIFIDTTDEEKVFIFSINSVYKFTFVSTNGRKVNYYYMYPHNYVLFDIKDNKYSRLGGDVYRIKTVVKDGFFKDKLKDNLNLGGILKGDKEQFFTNSYEVIKKESKLYSKRFKDIRNIDSFKLIGEKYIEKYFNYFINDTKKRIYYKQSVLNDISNLYKSNSISSDLTLKIIDKLETLRSYNKKDYNDVMSVLNGYYKVILKNNSIENNVVLENFLPLVKYLKLADNGTINSVEDLSKLINKNQAQIFNFQNKQDKTILVKQNLEYLYLLRNIDKKLFNKLVLNLELKYKQSKKETEISKNNLILIDKYYYGVLNLKQGNDDLELYVLLKNIYFSYDFSFKSNKIEKYFSNFVDKYFSQLKIVDGEIVLGQHLDVVLLESFLYYLEDYLNNFAFSKDVKNLDVDTLKLNIDILEKYFFLNKFIYFNENSSLDILKTGIFKNRDLLEKILVFIRYNLFLDSRDNNGLLLTSNKIVLDSVYVNKLGTILKNIFELKDKNKGKVLEDGRLKALLKSYDKLYVQYKEYMLALTSYEDYKIKYNTKEQELNDYIIIAEEDKLGEDDIRKYLSQFYGASLANTIIEKTNEEGVFLVKNYSVSGGTLSFTIEPERDYTIYNIILESDNANREKFYKNTYSLDREKVIWAQNKKFTKLEEKNKFDFRYYFKNKFFTKYSNEIYIKPDDDRNKIEESENIRIFKRDKLLGKRGEFSKIRDLLKINYNDIIANSLDNITIKNAEIEKKVGKTTYIFGFNSKYIIDRKNNKHYFYDTNKIKLPVYIKGSGGKKREYIGGNYITIDFIINLDEFNNIFEDLFSKLRILDKIYTSIKNVLHITKLDIEYKKDGTFIIGFDLNGKNIKLYLSGDKILFTKVDGITLNEKNVSVQYDLLNFLLKLKQ